MGSGGNLITMDKIYVKDLEVMGTIGILTKITQLLLKKMLLKPPLIINL